MNIQATKLELIKIIADVESEALLIGIKQLLLQAMPNDSNNSSSFSEEESYLITRINEGLPESVQLKYNDLLAKSVQTALLPEEHQELLALIPKVEAQTLERLKYLMQLAKLWDTSVDEVMSRLKITPPPVVYA